MDGEIKKGSQLKLMATGKTFEATEIGCFRPSPMELEALGPGSVGYLAGSLKQVADVPYGLIMAASVLVTLPLVILVIIFQRKIISGLTAGSVKG